jgi:hypothetical protein
MFVSNFRRPRPRGPKEIHHRMQKHPRQLQPRALATPNRGPVPARTSYEAPYAPLLHDLEQALIDRYENFEILTKLRMKFYGITQAVGEPADAFITKKTTRNTNRTAHDEGRFQRVLPNLVETRPPSPRRTTSCRK